VTFNLVALPVQSLGAGSARHSDVARLVEALTVELAGEKIDLPSFPDVATRVRRALTNEQVDVEHVVKIVSAEPALAARLLQLANSAALNPNGRRLTDLRTAVSRIGFNMARSAAIAFAMSQLRRAEAYKAVHEPLAELWQQSVHVAAMSHLVAKRFSQVNADTALLAGLLQSVGKLYLLTRAVRFPALLADTGTYQKLVAEWHGRLAEAILRNWELSDDIVDAIAASENLERDHEGTTDLTDVLAVATAMTTLGPDPRAEEMLFLGMPAARRMKLNADRCVMALADSQTAISSLRQALGT
jgi:HD-like signal output (HDOD) protein